MAGNTSNPGRSVTSRALSVLGSFDFHHLRLSLSQISRRSGLPVTTCHRILGELLAWGAVQKQQDGLYVIGPRLAQLGLLAPIQRGLQQLASPYMQDVLFATRQVVNLFVLDGTEALLLNRIAGSRVGAPIARPGDKLPLHTSAAGKVLLAYGSNELWELATRRLDLDTPRSITDTSRLKREMAVVRNRGYGTTDEEHFPGAYGLAVPVRDVESTVVAALGIVALARIKDPQRVVPALQVASAAITRSMSIPG